MGDQYVAVQPDDSGIFLTPEFDDLAEAQLFATDHGIGGAVELAAVFEISPFSAALELEQAKALKVDELTAEGNRRSELVDPHYLLVSTGYILGITVNALTPLGNQWSAVGVAWDDARVVINALGDLGSVQAYDVVTDPAWP